MDADPIKLTEHGIEQRLIDRDAARVLRRLHDFGFHAYLVGGSVRDLMLGRTPKDFDVVTSARPQEVRRLFRRCRLIGRRFRLAHVLGEDGKVIETATFRAKPSEGTDSVLITDDNNFGTPRSDAYRRDFTVNALFFDAASDEVIDYVGGLEDLKRRVLRTIGDPVTRFREDPVRMLRAVKFAARLDFEIDTAGRTAIEAQRAELTKAALPRLYEEMVRMLSGGAAAKSIELLDELRLLEILAPEIAAARVHLPPRWRAIERALLEGLNRRRGGPDVIPHGIYFAALFWPLIRGSAAAFTKAPRTNEMRALAEAMMLPIAVRLCVPKRTMESALGVMVAQFHVPRLSASKLATFASLPHYPGALAFAQLRGEAGEMEDRDADIWNEMAAKYPPPPMVRPAPRRRRRRPRQPARR
jgi:poly(A) polymerase